MGLNHTGELLVRMQALPFEAVFPTSEKGAIAGLGADAEWKRRVAEMAEKTGRTIVSSSLLRDVTP